MSPLALTHRQLYSVYSPGPGASQPQTSTSHQSAALPGQPPPPPPPFGPGMVGVHPLSPASQPLSPVSQQHPMPNLVRPIPPTVVCK